MTRPAADSQSLLLFAVVSLVWLRCAAARVRALSYRSYSKAAMHETLVVDCSHPSCQQITHHLKHKNVEELQLMDHSLRGDSSTDGVINAIKRAHPALLQNRFVTTNHFDIDSFLSVWCALYPEEALAHQALLSECSNIGDFRHLRLESDEHHRALKLACYLNSEERRLFYRPYEGSSSSYFGEDDAKFQHFLPVFLDVLRDTDAPQYEERFTEEYSRVVREHGQILRDRRYSEHPSIGLVCVRLEEPGHYYPLFSVSRDFDIVLAIYSGNRYEVEIKYTTMVDLASRDCLPRVEMTELAQRLNDLESAESPSEHRWIANRITDSGPLLRLESGARNLSKAERYGHPSERPVYPSRIPPADFEHIVISYFTHAYRGAAARRDWKWADLHQFNREIDWSQWTV